MSVVNQCQRNEVGRLVQHIPSQQATYNGAYCVRLPEESSEIAACKTYVLLDSRRYRAYLMEAHVYESLSVVCERRNAIWQDWLARQT